MGLQQHIRNLEDENRVVSELRALVATHSWGQRDTKGNPDKRKSVNKKQKDL